MAAVPVHEVWAAGHGADHAADHRAGRSGNDGAGARTDCDAFQRSGLRRQRQDCQRCGQQAGLERNAQGKISRVEAVLEIPAIEGKRDIFSKSGWYFQDEFSLGTQSIPGELFKFQHTSTQLAAPAQVLRCEPETCR
jgi:hypothetical protein